jgi:predicted phage terminase large subunit-like protein
VITFSAEERAVAATLAQNDYYFFCRYMFHARRGYGWQRARHHKMICEALMRVYRGECKRLIINIPPRYSKTELAIVNFMAWCLGKHPDCEFIHTSYSSRLSGTNSWQAREIVQSPLYQEIFPGTRIRNDSQAKDEWRTIDGGCVYAAGMSGTITGFGAGKVRPGFAGAILIDDPHKPDEVTSKVQRDGVIDFFQNTLESRKNEPSKTPIILIMQRLHQDDLSGWLMDGNNGEEWETLVLPALSNEGTDSDPDYQALWPEKHSVEKLLEMENASGYVFAGQYQQRPSPLKGGVFKPDNIEIVDAIPMGEVPILWGRGWDLAASIAGDWTVGFLLGRLHDGRYIIADLRRFRNLPDERNLAMLNTAKFDGRQKRISIPQDPGQAGKSQVSSFGKLLAGFNVVFSPESGDKVTRSEFFAAQVNIGNVLMLRAPWNKDVIDEMRMFPNGSYDDIVDASSRAFELIEGASPIVISDDAMRMIEQMR